MAPPVILLEFNELTPSLMDRFIAAGELPNFERLQKESELFITDADEKPPNLEPWIQWVTVHCGQDYSEHKVFELNSGHKLAVKSIWDLLVESGKRVWVCGSMNIRYQAGGDSFYLPDPWTTEVPPHPASLEPYFRFVRHNVIEHSNERSRLAPRDYAEFLAFMVRHGLSLETVTSIVKQLASERGGHNRWRRAFILDLLQYDLFASIYKRHRPDFSTFFLNSTAHMQHLYWRNLEPGRFQIPPTAEQQAEFDRAILAGYKAMDRLIGRFVELAGNEATLVFATALSQQPCLIYEEGGGKVIYRPYDFEAFLAWAGITAPHRVTPVMSEHFIIRFDNPADAVAASETLTRLRVDGEQAMWYRLQNGEVYGGCRIHHKLDERAMLTHEGRSTPFGKLFYQIGDLKSGMHHPDGMVWIRRQDRKHVVHPERIPLRTVAPMLLDMFSLPVPAYMTAPRAEPGVRSQIA
jgi:hypothetical protein